MTERAKQLLEEYEALVARPNEPLEGGGGVLRRWARPVLTRAHVPPHWRYDLDPAANPLCLERLGVNAVFNSGAIYFDGKYYLAARVEGSDRKSFFALASSACPTQNFRFEHIIELPDTCPEETNVYDMRLTLHEDGWIYGLFCSERKDPGDPDPAAAAASCGIVRTKDLRAWERLPNLKASSQQRNVALFPEKVHGMYAFLTRPQDGFIDAGSGGGICYAACADIENAEITEETLVSPREYHKLTEAKNGAGAPPIRTGRGWLHIAHGVRNTAAGLRYVLYAFVTDLEEPWRVIAQPSGYLLAPLGMERVGDVSNVLFCNGAAINGNDVAVYYASSDTRLHVATTTLEALLDYAFRTPPDPGRSAGCVQQRKGLIMKNEALLACGRWLAHVPAGDPWRAELEALAGDEPRRTDAFYRDLAFGTGGLRAEIGAGSNRMNHYVVGRATQGLANYLKKEYPGEPNLRACIAYDTRRCSKEFAEHCAKVLRANGIHVYLFAEARPTPMLSFAVRFFAAHTGIVITASHNPKQYNGYKAYNATGGQLTDEAAGAVLAEINALDYFDPLPDGDGEPPLLLDGKFDEIYYQAIEPFLPRREMSKEHGGNLKLLYSPLHGTGLVPVTQLLARLGYPNVTVVPSQEYQDEAHSFPTVKKPNPEEAEVFAPAIAMAKDLRPDVIFATDPDADRIGVLAQDKAGAYEVLTGTQTGALLADYLIQSYLEQGALPPNPAIVTTIVTGTLAERVCAANGVHTRLVLTGFKYIGEVMDAWKATGEHSFLFGFEESYGYLAGDACRDKDAVLAGALVAEMALAYKRRGMTLYDALQALYEKYGAVSEDVLNVEAMGAAGAAQIAAWMASLRENYAACLAGEEVVKLEDYLPGLHGLPPADVLKLYLADGSWLVVRPSGTEPKIKLYVCTDKAFAPGTPLEKAKARCAALIEKARGIFA